MLFRKTTNFRETGIPRDGFSAFPDKLHAVVIFGIMACRYDNAATDA